MDIICDAWEECRATDCQSECKDNQVLPCERTLFACTALKYSACPIFKDEFAL